MRIIARKTLKDFWETHADAEEPLKAWFYEAQAANWKSFQDIKVRYRSADAVFPILAGLSTNTISKMFLAGISGGRAFALRVRPGLIVVALTAWVGMLAT